jgi:enoyl-CoA hydratase
MSETLVLTERDGAVATVTVNRPDKLNALSRELLLELAAAFERLIAGGEEPVRAAVLTGAGKAFVAGADIAAMAEMSPREAQRFAAVGHGLAALLESAPFPVIAAVNGYALGGGLELALACDFIHAADTAKLGQPEVNLGLMPGFGGTQRLVRRVGVGAARELIYTGEAIGAEEALRIRLVNRVVPAAALLETARATARTIAGKGPLAVEAAKRVILHGADLTLAAACELEVQSFATLFGSDDQRAGCGAFLRKEKPAFTGR